MPSILPSRHRLLSAKRLACALLALTLAAPVASLASAAEPTPTTLRNDRYTLRLLDAATGSFELKRETGKPVVFQMRFIVGRAERDPNLAARPMAEVDNPVRYNVVTWEAAQGASTGTPASGAKTGGGIGALTDERVAGDGFDPRILRGSTEGRTADLFAAVPFDVLLPTLVSVAPTAWTCDYAPTAAGHLKATVSLPPGNAEPAIDYEWVPAAPGYHTIGFAGAPAHDLAAVDDIFQPLIFQEKRFPQRSYLTLAYRCTIPACLVTHDGQTVAVAADPKEIPFQPLPNQANSRFGIAVRNPSGKAQPMVFAPALGGAGSLMNPGEKFAFTFRLSVSPGRCADAFKELAEGLCQVTDSRRNVDQSLNQTLDNMIAYGLSDFSRFREEMKGCAYDTDAPGTVKNVSSLNPVDIAMVTDDAEIFQRRAYPYIEYMVSREKFLFTLDEAQKIQSPSYTLKGPCAPVSELAALYNIFGRASNAFLELAIDESRKSRTRNMDDVDSPDKWTNALWLYRATGNPAHLEAAQAGADMYIARRLGTPQSTFRDPDTGTPFFWTSFSPAFAQLAALHETTGEQRYLDAAHNAARQFAMFTWTLPVVPDKQVTVNPGGIAPLYSYLKSKGHKQMYAAEESVAAWRLSEIGLTCESSGTSTGHRGIFMANYAPWLLRIGNLKNDPFLTAVARNSIVGRYRNFPGYHINTARTTIYEKADYPLRPHDELSVNSFHYNHSWPMMSMLLDYLVTDAVTRSNGQISFPSEFIEGYAYLQNKAYGGRVGTFFGNNDAVLWMPRGLLKAESPQVNHIAARGATGQLYLALLNESDQPLDTTIAISQNLVPALAGKTLKATIQSPGTPPREIEIVSGVLPVSIAPRGLVAVTIGEARVIPKFQQKVMGLKASDAWSTSLVRFGQPAGRAMVLNLGPEAVTAFVYLEDSKRDFAQVQLTYTEAGETKTVTDTAFPWEFTIPLGGKATAFNATLSATKPDQTPHAWPPIELTK